MPHIPSDRNRPASLPVAALFLAVVAWAVVGVLAPQTATARATTFEDWLSLAEEGNAEAQCQIGVAYLNGSGVAQDFAKGLPWLMKSSDAGFPYARFVLADVFSRGYAGVPANHEKAYYYASLAAASVSLPERYRDRAIKIRDGSAKRLTPAQVARVQAMTALAPLHGAGNF